MLTRRRILVVALTVSAFTVFLGWRLLPPARAAATGITTLVGSVGSYTQYPVTGIAAQPPLAMLVMSRDEQLWMKAYDDYSDLNNDGVLDTTYNNDFSYTGYFDANLCYGYDATTNEFSATAVASNHQCDGASWSGNFLDWMAMSRIDVLRLVLYGGLRSVDTATDTVLKRAFVPNDEHAWVKVYRGSDVSKYTPFSDYPISFCNASMGNVGVDSSVSTAPPVFRVAKGDWSGWTSAERTQCQWYDSGSNTSQPEFPPLTDADGLTSYQVFVDVCNPGAASNLRESFCRQYGSSYKPAGLLQKFGETGAIRFGLMTGSYVDPRSGGILRRNIGLLAGNGGPGTFCSSGDEIDLRTGQFCYIENNTPQAGGIIDTLDELRIYGWAPTADNDQVYADCGTFGIQNRQVSSTSDKHLNDPGSSSGNAYRCNAWGNPLAEMFAESLRYIEGDLTPTAAFDPGYSSTSGSTADRAYIPNLPGPVWQDPYKTNSQCSQCSIVMISTGINTFDGDQVPSVTNLNLQAAPATTLVGNNEGITQQNNSSQYLVGRVLSAPNALPVGVAADTSNDTCTQQNVTDLALVMGICPDAPSEEGTYDLAGLAYEAWTSDLRPDISGQQRVQTYSVALSDNLPSFDLGVRASATTTDTVTIVPGCQALDTQVTQTDWHACGLMQLRVGPTTDPNTGATYGLPYNSNFTYGSFTVVWADSAYGADYDVDAVQVLSFCVGDFCSNTDNVTDPATGVTVNVGTQMCSGVSNNSNYCQNGQFKSNANIQPSQVLVRTEGIYDSTYMPMRLGYSVAGPNNTQNGFYLGTTITGNGDLAYGSDATPPSSWNPPDVAKWSTGPSQQNLLPTPLFLAAKYGGFTYPDGATNPMPTNVAQWDQINNDTGAKGSDGLPDNYFPVRNPSVLASRLSTVFQAILKRAGSGTAAAVVANEREGIGATYQALYEPSRTDSQGRTVTWIGSLQALFVDSKGNLREDPNHTHQLIESDYTANPAVQIVYDTNTNTTVVHRWTVDPSTNPSAFVTVPLDQLNSLWNARDELDSSALTTNITSNRTYTGDAGTGRYIFTCLDTSLTGCNSSQVQPFIASTFTNNNYGILNVSSKNQAQEVVNYIRGQEQAGMRNRTIDYFNNGQTEIMRLGDIVDSTPTVVGAPSESFDVLYNDQTYHNFFEQYKQRRNVIYVGANDGMLHAFNGGFYNSATHTFDTSPPSGQSGADDPLGSELWAYVPFNLLPHLQWLTDPIYTHVWYVDDKPRVFDARIFNADATHPDGWGTVMVVGMRMGGANLTLPAGSVQSNGNISANSGFSDFGNALSGTNTTQITTHSAYVVMDITDPEQPPTLLAEISDPNTSTTSKIGFTTSYPTVMAFRPDPAATTGDHWYLIFGNGPTDLQTATSSNDASLFVYDLTTRQPVSGFPKDLHTALDGSTGTTYANSFVGDPVSVDWNLDFDADAVYVGTAGGSAASPAGSLVKLTTGCLSGGSSCSSPANWTVSTLLNPGAPTLATPTVTQDAQGNHWILDGTGRLFVAADKASSAQQYLYGVIDTLDSGAGSPPSFSNLVDTTSAQVATNGSVGGVTFAGQSVTDEVSLASDVQSAGGWKILLSTDGTNPAERSLSTGDLIGNIFFDSTYIPDLSDCLSLGESALFGLNFATGAASQTPVFGTRQVVINGNTLTLSISKIELGKGLGAAPTLHLGSSVDNTVTVFTQTSTGAIVQANAKVGPTAKSGETDWREDHGP